MSTLGLASSSSSTNLRRNALDTGGAFGDYDLKTSPSTAAFVQLELEERYLRQKLVPKLTHDFVSSATPSSVASTILISSTESIYEGMQVIAEDDFWKCFEKTPVTAWNFNPPLLVLWLVGVLLRYLVLFPIRAIILASGWLVFGSAMVIATALSPVLPRAPKDRFLRLMISWMSSCFVLTWSGVIRYHGHIPVPKQPGGSNFVFVANHSSLIDVIVLQQCKCFSLVGQKHKGLVSFLQNVVLACLQCIWFDRGEMKDRSIVSRKLQEHAKDPRRNPLLVFPEGTCVNNEHVIQFKKGVFELGVPIAPVAIKYNKLFVDPFWSSRDQSFAGHIFELMTSWCMICDVYFMEPTVRRDGESGEDFANRVRDLIAHKARIRAVDWDGYLKHFQPNERLINKRKDLYAKQFKKLLEDLKRRRNEGWKGLGSLVEEGEEEEDDEEDDQQAAHELMSSSNEASRNEEEEEQHGELRQQQEGGSGRSLSRPTPRRANSMSSQASSSAASGAFLGPAVLGGVGGGGSTYSRMPFRANSQQLTPPPPPPIIPAPSPTEEDEEEGDEASSVGNGPPSF